MTFRRRSGRKEIVLPEGAAQPQADEPAAPSPLLLAIARAHRWQEMLDSGEVASITDIAKRLKVDPAHVSRTLVLAALAPDLVEAVLADADPADLSVARLVRDLPPRWDQQREVLGF